jgi:hypothetical protein
MCTRTVLTQRIDDAAEVLGLTFDQLVRLQKVMLPEIFDRPPARPDPTDDPGLPGTHQRVTAMAKRYARAAPLFQASDPVAEDWLAGTRRQWLLVLQLQGPDEYHARLQARAMLRLKAREDFPEWAGLEKE